MSIETWNRILSVNLSSIFYAVKFGGKTGEKVPPKLEERDPGKSVKTDPRWLVESAPLKLGQIDPAGKE
jgi:hypothetical protein